MHSTHQLDRESEWPADLVVAEVTEKKYPRTKTLMKRYEELDLESPAKKRSPSPPGDDDKENIPPPPQLKRENAILPSRWRSADAPDVYGATYPLPQSYDFAVGTHKRVDKHLSVCFVGLKYGFGSRTWAFTITSPPCLVKYIDSKYQNEHKKARAMLTPCPPDGHDTSYPDQFLAFVDHLEKVSMILKDQLDAAGHDVSNWHSPIIEEEGIVTGLYAKVKNEFTRNVIDNDGNKLRCALKLSCAYFAKDRSGLSFELSSAFNS
jgi:hypothetical protein